MKQFRVGIDAYSLKPLDLDPFELLDWAIINEADGVQFSEVPPEADDPGFLRELAQYAAQNDLYLEWGGGEHIPFDLTTGRPKDIAPVNERAARQAAALGVRTVRSCSGGLMRWREDAIPTETLLRDMAKSLRAQTTDVRAFRRQAWPSRRTSSLRPSSSGACSRCATPSPATTSASASTP